jgi:RNA polymerase sigma-70 factor (ECF subfamily)
MDAPREPSAQGGASESLEFSQIYSRYFGFVWSSTRRLGVSECELDDVVQDIFMVIHARLRTLEKPESIRSWIYGIIRRSVSTYHRAKRSKKVSNIALSAEPEVHFSSAPSPLEVVERDDEAKLLWSLLEGLDPPKREAFVLVELEEMTVPEIAMALEVPVNTVYSRLRVAREELEAALLRHNVRNGKRVSSCPT